MISLYRLCRIFAAVAVKPADRQLLGKGGQVFGGRFIDFEIHQLGSLGNQVGISGRELSRLRLVVLVVAEDDERGGGSGRFGSGLGFGGRLGHDRSPETPKGPSGPLCGKTDRIVE